MYVLLLLSCLAEESLKWSVSFLRTELLFLNENALSFKEKQSGNSYTKDSLMFKLIKFKGIAEYVSIIVNKRIKSILFVVTCSIYKLLEPID